MRINFFYVVSLLVVSFASFVACDQMWCNDAVVRGHAWVIEGHWQWKPIETESPTQQRAAMEASYLVRMKDNKYAQENQSAEPAL
jgi:hypothetical protein